MQAVKSGQAARIAVVYLEWAGVGYQNVLVPWALIERPEDALNFAAALAAQPITRPSHEHARTSISGGLLSALALFANASPAAARQVVDISGDGTNNSGFAIVPVRDALVARGITGIIVATIVTTFFDGAATMWPTLTGRPTLRN